MLWQSLYNQYGSKYFHPTVPSPDPTPSDGKHLSSARIPSLPWDGPGPGCIIYCLDCAHMQYLKVNTNYVDR